MSDAIDDEFYDFRGVLGRKIDWAANPAMKSVERLKTDGTNAFVGISFDEFERMSIAMTEPRSVADVARSVRPCRLR
jgi:hypothetical protein